MTVILLRHGLDGEHGAIPLAGARRGGPGRQGLAQARSVVDRIGDLPVRALITSPLLRCQRTVEPLADRLGLQPVLEDRLAEVDYGDWTGRQARRTGVRTAVAGGAAASQRRGLPRREARPTSRPAPFQPCENTIAGLRTRTAAVMCSGWRAPTATSSSPSSPTRWALI